MRGGHQQGRLVLAVSSSIRLIMRPRWILVDDLYDRPIGMKTVTVATGIRGQPWAQFRAECPADRLRRKPWARAKLGRDAGGDRLPVLQQACFKIARPADRPRYSPGASGKLAKGGLGKRVRHDVDSNWASPGNCSMRCSRRLFPDVVSPPSSLEVVPLPLQGRSGSPREGRSSVAASIPESHGIYRE